jgi:uncharacterized membrane protein
MRASVPFGDLMPIVLRRAFVAAALAWAALLVAVPFIASRAHATSAGTVVVVAVYGIGSLVCHQLPARSWRLWTAQMPVCARCAGIYAGAAIAALLAVILRSPERLALPVPRIREVFGSRRQAREPFRRAIDREPFSRAAARVLLSLAALPSLATLVYEWTTGVMPSNALRFAAGVPIGVAVAWLIVSAAEDQVN